MDLFGLFYLIDAICWWIKLFNCYEIVKTHDFWKKRLFFTFHYGKLVAPFVFYISLLRRNHKIFTNVNKPCNFLFLFGRFLNFNFQTRCQLINFRWISAGASACFLSNWKCFLFQLQIVFCYRILYPHGNFLFLHIFNHWSNFFQLSNLFLGRGLSNENLVLLFILTLIQFLRRLIWAVMTTFFVLGWVMALNVLSELLLLLWWLFLEETLTRHCLFKCLMYYLAT